MHRLLARLLLLSALLVPSSSRLVFDSVAHLGSLPGARADADFLLSFFALNELGTRFVVATAPNGSALASHDGGVSWTLQGSKSPVGSYAALPTVYESLGGWPPRSGLPMAFAAVSLQATYEPPAPANFTYTGKLVTLSAARQPPCLKLTGSVKVPPAVGTEVSFSLVSHDRSLCAFPTNGSRAFWSGHVCATDGSILWEKVSTPYHIPPANLGCNWSCAVASQFCGAGCGGRSTNVPGLPSRLCSADESGGVHALFHASSDGPAVRYTGLPAAAVQFIPGDGNTVRLKNGTWVATVGVWFAKDAPVSKNDEFCIKNDKLCI